MSREGRAAYQKYDGDDDFDIFSAIRMATKVFPGSPLYFAMASPYPEDLSNY
jgi:hypothetical protein